MTSPRYGGWGLSRKDMTSTLTPLDKRGPKRLWNAPAGWVMKRSGAVDEPVALEYLCPVHGRFTARVSKDDTPDEMPCPSRLTTLEAVALYEAASQGDHACGLTSPWSPSGFAAWKSSGEVTG
jgi:hypothetical protein